MGLAGTTKYQPITLAAALVFSECAFFPGGRRSLYVTISNFLSRCNNSAAFDSSNKRLISVAASSEVRYLAR